MKDLAHQYWMGIAVGAVFGYALHLTQAAAHDVLASWRAERRDRKLLAQHEDITRILTGIELDTTKAMSFTVENPVPSASTRQISPSPLVLAGYRYEERVAEDWDYVGYRPPTQVEPPQADASGRTWRQRIADFWEAGKPRSPEQVALQAYEDAVLEQGELYEGAHRADGYTQRQVRALNTATGEFPSLRHLRRGWNNNQAPVPAEVFV